MITDRKIRRRIIKRISACVYDFSDDSNITFPALKCVREMIHKSEQDTAIDLLNSPYLQLKAIIATSEKLMPDVLEIIEKY